MILFVTVYTILFLILAIGSEAIRKSLRILCILRATKISRDVGQHQRSACVILYFLCSLCETYVVSNECQRERSNPLLRILRILRAIKISRDVACHPELLAVSYWPLVAKS